MANDTDRAWSYSRLSCYEKCPALFKYRNIDKLPEPKNPAMARGIKIHNEAADYIVGKRKAIPESCVNFEAEFNELRELRKDPGTKVIVEQKWGFGFDWRPTKFFSKSVVCRATLDAAVIYDDGTADVIDHKTGKRYDDDYMDQMGLFAASTMLKFLDVEHVTARMWYLDQDEEVVAEFDTAKAMDALDDLEERAKVMMGASRFPPRPNFSCQWCHFRRENGGPCKH